jgi:hypothetical protein
LLKVLLGTHVAFLKNSFGISTKSPAQTLDIPSVLEKKSLWKNREGAGTIVARLKQCHGSKNSFMFRCEHSEKFSESKF